ncbi:MAG: hypothetical protein OXN18_13675 [Gemmatimonadota bacterium]|nr:hypothetical protein [Gemmatimonadota bacterium]
MVAGIGSGVGGRFAVAALPGVRCLGAIGALRRAAPATARLAIPLLVALAIPPEAAAQTYQRGQNVAPAFEGWERNEDGSFSFLFGYMNRNWLEEVDVPVGEHNAFSPGPADRGQPTHFLPRRNRFVFKVRVPADWGDRELVWTLTSNGVTERAYATLRPDYVVDNVVIMSETGALGAGSSNARMRANEPPTITLEGPVARQATVGVPLGITVLVEDDGLLRSRRRPPGPPPETAADSARADSIWNAPPTFSRRQLTPPSRITVQKANGLFMSWFLYRGEGAGDETGDGGSSATGESRVTFDPPQIKVWEDTRAGANSPWAPLWVPPELPEGGLWTVNVTFDRPGTYLLRGRADDGGLFADVEVTVTVRPVAS